MGVLPAGSSAAAEIASRKERLVEEARNVRKKAHLVVIEPSLPETHRCP